MPTGGGGLNVWLRQCAAQQASAAASGSFLNELGQDWNVGLFFHTLGNILVGPNPPYPTSPCGAEASATPTAATVITGSSATTPAGAMS